MKIIVKLKEKIKRTETVQSFRFIPGKKIDFLPGHFLQVIFDRENLLNKELNKYLSFSSSPTRDYIEFTKRLSESPFSQRLKNLSINEEILIEAPLGNCVFKEEYKKIGFLIGGIGITPVISILEYILEKNLSTSVSLLYANRSEEEIAFYPELESWQSSGNIKVYFFVDLPSRNNSLIFDKIDKKNINKYIPDIKERITFIFGHPKMVAEMKSICL
ncbi:MAG: ferredoxin--NADP reductase, partial [Candidatus Omnitrophota bacterium]